MRILHTADWHLGRIFNGYSLLEDQAKVVDLIADIVESEAPELFVLAGDVFDRANPRREAVELFDRFLERIYRKTSTAIVVIAGNHDAPERIGFGGALHDRARVLIRGGLARSAAPLLLEDEAGKVAVTAIPYAGVFAARDHFNRADIATPEDVIAAEMEEANALLPPKCRQIVVSHTFVAGGRGSESERSLEAAGGIEVVRPERYEGASYVALGHLHAPQEIACNVGRLRYSGSILPFGFDEIDREKSVTLVDLQWWGVASVETIALEPPRPLRVVRGSFDEVVGSPADLPEAAFVKLELTDAATVPDAMSRLRERFPNAVQLEWVNRRILEPEERLGASREGLREPVGVIHTFYREVMGEELPQEQQELVEETLAACREEES